MEKYEILPNKVEEVIGDIKKCTEALVRTCSLLEDCIIILNTPILVLDREDNERNQT